MSQFGTGADMAGVIYMSGPRGIGARTGAAVNEGFNKGFAEGLAKQDRIEKAQRVSKMLDELRASPDRKTALEKAAIITTQAAEDVQDVQLVYGLVDKFFPQKDQTPTKVDVVTPDNKRESKYIPAGELPTLNTPQGVESIFGPGYKVQRPEQEYDFFAPDATGKGPTLLGRGPLSARPQGSQTKEEMDLAAKGKADARAEENLKLAQEREARLQGQMNKVLEKVAASDRNRISDNFRADSSAGERLIMRGLGKVLPDGTFGFDDDNKQEIFNKRAELFNTMLADSYKKNPNANFVNFGEIAAKAVKAFPTRAETPKPPQPKKPDETKKIGGKTYYRYGTKWYDGPL